MKIRNMMDAKNKYKIVYKKYISVILDIFRRKNKINAILHNRNLNYPSNNLIPNYAELINNDNPPIYNLYLNSNNIKCTYNDKNITLADKAGVLGDIFCREEYGFLEVENEMVEDIGANIGDFQIYFALINAKNVITLEPYPFTYRIELTNFKKNDIEDKIILLNAGYSRNGTIKVNLNLEYIEHSNLKSFNNGIDIKIFSLKTLLNDHHKDIAVIKIDCKGSEHNLLKENNDTLRKFKRMQVACHYGYGKFKGKLEDAGFTVTYSKPVKLFNKDATEHKMVVGYINTKSKM
jgi:FkbM family methyltransferase